MTSFPTGTATYVCLTIAVLPRSQPTQELADAISDSFSTGKNLETNTILFMFAWKLFAKDDDGNPAFVKLGENTLSAGKHLICAIEKSIRSPKKDEISQKYAETREIFFKTMLECMGPREGQIKYDGSPCRGCMLELTYCVT